MCCVRLTDRHGFCSAAATRALLRRMEAERPDVIHLHNLHGYYLHVGLLFAWLKRAGIPVLWTPARLLGVYRPLRVFRFRGLSPVGGRLPRLSAGEKLSRQLGADASIRNWRDKRTLLTGVPRLTLVTPSRWLGSWRAGLFGRLSDPGGAQRRGLHPCSGPDRRRGRLCGAVLA